MSCYVKRWYILLVVPTKQVCPREGIYPKKFPLLCPPAMHMWITNARLHTVPHIKRLVFVWLHISFTDSVNSWRKHSLHLTLCLFDHGVFIWPQHTAWLYCGRFQMGGVGGGYISCSPYGWFCLWLPYCLSTWWSV